MVKHHECMLNCLAVNIAGPSITGRSWIWMSYTFHFQFPVFVICLYPPGGLSFCICHEFSCQSVRPTVHFLLLHQVVPSALHFTRQWYIQKKTKIPHKCIIRQQNNVQQNCTRWTNCFVETKAHKPVRPSPRTAASFEGSHFSSN